MRIQVYVNHYNGFTPFAVYNEKTGRVPLNAELLEDRPKSVLVKLPNGDIIVRKKNRDIV